VSDVPNDAADTPVTSARVGSGGMQSLERAFGLLELIAGHGGSMTLSTTLARVGAADHHAASVARTLVGLGYLRQEPSRSSALGTRLALLADASSAVLTVVVPHPGQLAISVSGPAPLMSDELLTLAVPVLRDAAARMAAELS